MENTVRLDLTEDEAIVLFDFLRRFDKEGSLTIRDQAEECALWNLHSQLKKQRVAAYYPKYRALLKSARSRLREKYPRVYRVGTTEEIWKEMRKRIRKKTIETLSADGHAKKDIIRAVNKLLKEQSEK